MFDPTVEITGFFLGFTQKKKPRQLLAMDCHYDWKKTVETFDLKNGSNNENVIKLLLYGLVENFILNTLIPSNLTRDIDIVFLSVIARD